MTPARVFIHPRCVQGPAAGALVAYLQTQGYDTNTVVCGPPSKRGYCELVRVLDEGPLAMTLQRFDNTQFQYMKPTQDAA